MFWIESDNLSGRTFGALIFAITKAFLKKDRHIVAIVSPNKRFHEKTMEIVKKFQIEELCDIVDLNKSQKYVVQK